MPKRICTGSDFAKRLQTLREHLGLSQYELARRTGLTRQTLSRLEMGDRDPTWGTVQLLALALGVDYRHFADPSLTLPAVKPVAQPGRPRKAGPENNGQAEPKPARGRPRKAPSVAQDTTSAGKGGRGQAGREQTATKTRGRRKSKEQR